MKKEIKPVTPDFIKSIGKRTLLDEIKYYLWYAPIRYLDMLPRRIYWFFQRGYRGFGDNDTWDFDHYLATVISQGLKHLKKYYNGSEPTKKELKEMIDGFEANLKMMNNLSPKSKEYKKLKIKFHKGMKLLEKYFNYLWD
jgi:hypothetical protein